MDAATLFPPALRFALIVAAVYICLPLSVGYFLAGSYGAITAAVGFAVYGDLPRRRIADFPGPPRRWLIGNLPEFVKLGGYHEVYSQLNKEYGPVAAVALGHRAQLVIADPDLIREICLTKFTHFRDRMELVTMRKSKGLLTAKGDQWHSSRRTLNPAFNTVQLSVFAEIISHHCDALVRRLEKVVNEYDGGPIDIFRASGTFTMDVIGSTSFDADFKFVRE